MKNKFEKIESIVETYMFEAPEDGSEAEENEEKGLIKIFYADLDIDGKQKVMEAIDEHFDYVDVFSDDVVRDTIEEALGRRPLITLSAEELVNKMDIEL